MSDEEAFQAELDKHPESSDVRMIFADWLDERDDPRGYGYRIMGKLGIYPKHIEKGARGAGAKWWVFHNSGYVCKGQEHMTLPSPLDYALLTRCGGTGYCNDSRRLLEDSVALAFATFTTKRVAELLAEKMVSV
jgi:uncharacterized protein (TIGR02996 family)